MRYRHSYRLHSEGERSYALRSPYDATRLRHRVDVLAPRGAVAAGGSSELLAHSADPTDFVPRHEQYRLSVSSPRGRADIPEVEATRGVIGTHFSGRPPAQVFGSRVPGVWRTDACRASAMRAGRFFAPRCDFVRRVRETSGERAPETPRERGGDGGGGAAKCARGTGGNNNAVHANAE